MLGAGDDPVSPLLEGDSEHLARLVLRRLPRRIDLQHAIGAIALAAQDIQSLGLVAGRDDAVGDLALEELGGGHVDHVGEGRPVAERAKPVGPSRAGVGGGQRRELQVVDEGRALDRLAHGHRNGGARRAHVLERRGRGELKRPSKLAHQLPGVARVQEVDVAGRARQHANGQGPLGRVNPGRRLVGIASIAQSQFVHGSFLAGRKRPHSTNASASSCLLRGPAPAHPISDRVAGDLAPAGENQTEDVGPFRCRRRRSSQVASPCGVRRPSPRELVGEVTLEQAVTCDAAPGRKEKVVVVGEVEQKPHVEP